MNRVIRGFAERADLGCLRNSVLAKNPINPKLVWAQAKLPLDSPFQGWFGYSAEAS